VNNKKYMPDIAVAPFAGAWIEIKVLSWTVVSGCCRTLRGCNILLLNRNTEAEASVFLMFGA